MCKSHNLIALVLVLAGLAVAPAMGQFQNGDFETVGGTPPAPTNWILSGVDYVSGTWMADLTARSATHFIGRAANWGQATGTATQNVTVSPGTYAITLSFWGQMYDHGGQKDELTGEIIVDGVSKASVILDNSSVINTSDYTTLPYTQKTVNWTGAVTSTVTVKFTLHANGTGPSNPWGIVCLDDAVLQIGSAGQAILSGITPRVIPDSSSNTNAAIAGVNLAGATAAKLIMGTTTLSGTITANDGSTMSVTFPTTGAPAGRYDVQVEKPGFDPAVLAESFTIRGPGLNLLRDGDFEATGTLAASGWTVWAAGWDGIGGITKYTSPHPSIFQPAPDVWDGTQSMEQQEGGTGEGGVLQVVDVFPGETLTLDWVWMAGDQADGSDTDHQAWHGVGIQTGAIASAQSVQGDIDDIQIGNVNGQFDWTLVSRTFTVPAGVNQITVYTKTGHCCVDSLVATRFDNMRLMSAGTCAAQHTVSAPVSPASNDNNNNTTITVTGTDLNLVTEILLIPSGGGPAIIGTNLQLGAGNTTLTADFATNGAKADVYHIRTDQDWPCTFQLLSSVFTLTCPDPSAVTPPIDPAVIDQQVQTPGMTLFTINGTNLDVVNAVTLSGPQTINGAIVTQTAGQITANFDLTGAALGKYTLTAVRNDGCTSVVVADAFELKCGAGGASYLATVDAWGGMSGTNPFTFDLTGSGLQSLTQVRLVKLRNSSGVLPGSTGNPVVSTNLVPNGDGTRLTVTMDLTGVEGGRYKVEATHPCGLVSYASGFADGPFLVWMPFNSTRGPNGSPLVFQNPSFEEAFNNSTNPGLCEAGFPGDANPKAKHWDQVSGQESAGSWSRDKALGFGAPDCGPTGPIAIIDGKHYEDQSMAVGADQTKSAAFFQTVDASPLLDANGALAQELTVRAIFALHAGDGADSLKGYIELRDGPEGAAVLATSAPIPTLDLKFAGDPAWKVTLPAGTLITNPAKIITVIFRAEKQPATQSFPWLIMRVDNVYTGSYVQPGCHLPFADSDGDQDVDQVDFAAFQACYTGQGGIVTGDCLCFDRIDPGQAQADGDIDQTDMQAFEACASGAGIPADPACGN